MEKNMKITRRNFLGYSATITAVVTIGFTLNASAKTIAGHPNQAEIDSVAQLIFSSAAMPSLFTITNDISGL
ncbi:MAG: hypothetical protein ACJAYG_000594 [Oceanicoccus sp.]|jgi:hypothetical protein